MCIETTLHVYRNDFDLYRNDLYRNDFVSKRPDTIETMAACMYANEHLCLCFYILVCYSLLFSSEITLTDNYSPRAQWTLSNDPLDFISAIIRQYPFRLWQINTSY